MSHPERPQPEVDPASFAAEAHFETQSVEELIDRARRSYLRALGSAGRSVPAELASTLALVPTLCRQLEVLSRSQGSARGRNGGDDVVRLAEHDRERVLRVVGHELRNRLNSPRLHVRLLEETLSKHGDDEPRRLSELLSSGIESAASVVDDIACLLSPPREREAPLRTLILELVGQHAARAAQQGVALEVVEPLSSASFPSCGLKLVLENLILNAIEHHHAGPGAWVRVATQRRGDEVAVRVEDNGPGLPREVEDRLLGRSPNIDRSPQGSGFGLVVVARAIESLGARLELLPGEGEGTRVVVHLRRER